MTRRPIVVAGGTGFFGATIVGRLRADGFDPRVASRHGPVRLDVEDAESVRTALREGDVVVDAVGPFQRRTATLARLAGEVGFDVVDISDSLSYCERVLALPRVLTAYSTVSAVTAALVRATGVRRPESVETLLVPEASASSRPAAARSLLQSVGRPIRVLRGGALVATRGWERVEGLDARPLGVVAARRMETADAVTLPRLFPSVRNVDFLVTSRMPWLDAMIGAAGACRLTALLGWGPALSLGLPLARLLAPRGSGCFVRVSGDGVERRAGLVADEGGHVIAALPAVLAAEAISEGRFDGSIPDSHLFAAMEHLGIRRADLE